MALTTPYSRRRSLLAAAISLMPANGLRVGLYRRLLGYSLGRGTRIGLTTIIATELFATGTGVTIGRGNKFVGPFRVTIGDGVLIGRFNLFSCGATAADPGKATMGYARRLTIGERVLINDRHYFDVYGHVSIGAGTWVAGADSQFWTHGASTMDRDIAIGVDCYLGSAIRMAPGSMVGDRCVVGLASVIVSKLSENDSVLAGFPARKLRDIDADDDRKFVFEMT